MAFDEHARTLDREGRWIVLDQLHYDNAASGLTASDAQAAIDEVAADYAFAYVGPTEPVPFDTGDLWLDTSSTGTGTETLGVVTKTTTYTITTSDAVVLCDASGGAFTVTLPTAASAAQQVFRIKKIDTSANAVTVDGDSAETIDGSTAAVLASAYDALTIVSDGTEWWIL